MSEADLTPVSVTQGDRILTGVGADPDRLADTMERHAPKDAEPPKEVTQAPAADSQQPKESRGSKRIAQITKEREEERERREAVEKERDELRAKLSSQPAPISTPREESKQVPAVAEKPATTRAKPTESEVGSKYDTYADFVEDLADWKAEQRLAAIDLDARISQRIEGDRASRTQQEHVSKAMERGRAAYADFNAVLSAPHMLQPWPGEKILAIAKLEEPEHIQYQLGKDPALAERLRTADPVQFGMELARLIPAPAVVTQASTAGAGTVTPPPPFQPVGAGSKSTAPPLADLVKKGGFDYDRSGYREKRAAELGRGTRRR